MVLNFLYQLGKDIIEASKFTEKEKLVDRNFLELSGFQKKIEQEGYVVRWTRPDLIETRLLQGYEIFYEVDKIKQIKTKLIRSDGNILMAKRGKGETT